MILLLLIIPLVSAEQVEDFNDKTDLTLSYTSEGEMNLQGSSGFDYLTAILYLFPRESQRQEVLSLTTTPTSSKTDTDITFTWDSFQEKLIYQLDSEIKTINQIYPVEPASFPIQDLDPQYEQYLAAEEIIDITPEIITKASQLTAGETDLYTAVYKVATWVNEGVEYDLNTLTSQASQKASWVLENEQGVCDEMTSLFVAMARSLGIPARFVSGISYTTSELFDENWQPHGWAEVFFPDIGWVSFDITFGEYGYIDVTHIKLRDGFDPAEPATKFEWLASNVLLTTEQLSFNVNLYDKGTQSEPEILVEQEILSDEIGFGSYNLVKGIIKNNQPYYTATTVQLAVPEEIEIIERNKRTILLHPHEVRETYWIVNLLTILTVLSYIHFPQLSIQKRMCL